MKVLLGFLSIVGGLAVLIAISLLYDAVREKLHKPKIGLWPLMRSMLKRNCYVCIGSGMYIFWGYTRGGEIIDILRPPLNGNFYPYAGDLMFKRTSGGLGYAYFSPSVFANQCNFVYGKYGLVWARSEEWAKKAEILAEDFYEADRVLFKWLKDEQEEEKQQAASTGGKTRTDNSTPLEMLPRNEKGEPMFEAARSPEHAWDALVEFSKGKVATAKAIADIMVEEKRKELEKAHEQKLNGKTPTEMLASKKANDQAMRIAWVMHDFWRRIAAAGRDHAG